VGHRVVFAVGDYHTLREDPEVLVGVRLSLLV
jgi:hypothetical protein